MTLSAIEHKALGIMSRYERGMTAGMLGEALWTVGDNSHLCRDNAQATKYCRPAGAILRRLERNGLVISRFDGMHVWRVTPKWRKR